MADTLQAAAALIGSIAARITALRHWRGAEDKNPSRAPPNADETGRTNANLSNTKDHDWSC